MPTISKSYIRRLVESTRIEDVIGRRIRLIKKGREFSAVCPFHSENTPSFTVSPQKQFYYCFGCHASGNSIDFICNFEKFEFPQAIEILAEISGLPIEYDDLPEIKDTINKTVYTKMYNDLVEGYEKHIDINKGAIDYVASRKISKEIVKFFRIGFAPKSNHAQFEFLKKMYDSKQIAESGLFVDKSGKMCDRFQNRLIFPIRNRRGDIIALGGRTLSGGIPKYLNSPETAWFHKSKVLYGLYETMNNNNQPDKIIVVEGYTDVIKLFQNNFNYSVAALGTAFSQSHYMELCRVTPLIVFCFDGDKAGVRAALKACKVCLSSYQDSVDITFLLLPDDHDPDSYIEEYGSESFSMLIANSMSIENFLFEFLKSTYSVQKTSGLANYINDLRLLIDSMPNNASKHIFMRRLKNEQLYVVNDSNQEVIKKDSAYGKPSKDCNIISVLISNPMCYKSVLELADLFPSLITTRIFTLAEAIFKYSLKTTADLCEWNRNSNLINVAEFGEYSIQNADGEAQLKSIKHLITMYLINSLTCKIQGLLEVDYPTPEGREEIRALLKEKSSLKVAQESLEYHLINVES